MTPRTLAQIDADIDTAQAAQRAADANVLALLAERTEALNRPLTLTSSPNILLKGQLLIESSLDGDGDLFFRFAGPAQERQSFFLYRTEVEALSAHLLRLLSTCGNGNVQL